MSGGMTNEEMGFAGGRFTRECEARGLAPVTVGMRCRELDRCGTWLNYCWPKVSLEQSDSGKTFGRRKAGRRI